MLDKVIYETIKFFRNKETVKFVNEIMEIDNSNLVMENVYLGNIIDSQNLTFLTNNNIGAIVNCTENEPFHPYFDDLNSTNNKYKIRLEINDSKDAENLDKFLNIIDTGVEFINTQTISKTFDLACGTQTRLNWLNDEPKQFRVRTIYQ